jgi:hypothetical protein
LWVSPSFGFHQALSFCAAGAVFALDGYACGADGIERRHNAIVVWLAMPVRWVT